MIARKHVPARWLIIQDTEVYQEGFKKLFPRHDECLTCGGDCGGQWREKTIIKSEPFLLELKIKNQKHTYYELML